MTLLRQRFTGHYTNSSGISIYYYQLKISGRAQRKAARRRKSDVGLIWGEVKFTW